MIYLLIYIDDMLMVSKDKVKVIVLNSQLRLVFEMKDLRSRRGILGIKITRNKRYVLLYLSQI